MTDISIEDPPIACALGAGDFTTRLAWIAALNRDALLSEHREDLRLTLVYASSARGLVENMVARERACCAFLAFDLRDVDDGVLLTITAPEAARAAVEAIFAPFLQGPAPAASASAGCGCRGAAAA